MRTEEAYHRCGIAGAFRRWRREPRRPRCGLRRAAGRDPAEQLDREQRLRQLLEIAREAEERASSAEERARVTVAGIGQVNEPLEVLLDDVPLAGPDEGRPEAEPAEVAVESGRRKHREALATVLSGGARHQRQPSRLRGSAGSTSRSPRQEGCSPTGSGSAASGCSTTWTRSPASRILSRRPEGEVHPQGRALALPPRRQAECRRCSRWSAPGALAGAGHLGRCCVRAATEGPGPARGGWAWPWLRSASSRMARALWTARPGPAATRTRWSSRCLAGPGGQPDRVSGSERADDGDDGEGGRRTSRAAVVAGV